MNEAIAILKRHLAEAVEARAYHRRRGRIGNVEALVAGLKITWLKDLLREIEKG